VSERRRDALSVQNVAGGDDVLLDLIYVHWLLFPYFSPAQMSNSEIDVTRSTILTSERIPR
jgi:hypothetical protein